MAGKRLADGLASVTVPQPHRLVGAAGDYALPIRAERHTEDRAAMARERLSDLLSGSGVKQSHGPRRRYRRQCAARLG
jgi:hypothetical protein